MDRSSQKQRFDQLVSAYARWVSCVNHLHMALQQERFRLFSTLEPITNIGISPDRIAAIQLPETTRENLARLRTEAMQASWSVRFLEADGALVNRILPHGELPLVPTVPTVLQWQDGAVGRGVQEQLERFRAQLDTKYEEWRGILVEIDSHLAVVRKTTEEPRAEKPA